MICPHCRFETLGETCSHCGWEALKANIWAAREAETVGRLDRASVYWNAAKGFALGDPSVGKSAALCLTRLAVQTRDKTRFEAAASALRELLQEDGDWEEGHQMSILLHDRFDENERLLRQYESEGESSKRWADIVRLVRRFREEKQTFPASRFSREGRVWLMRVVFFLIGMGLLSGGSLWCREAVVNERKLLPPILTTVFGLGLATGSTMLYWRDEKKKPKVSIKP